MLQGHLSNMNVIQKMYVYFNEMINIQNREMDEQSFCNPHPRNVIELLLI